jgi:hypothetical protein
MRKPVGIETIEEPCKEVWVMLKKMDPDPDRRA